MLIRSEEMKHLLKIRPVIIAAHNSLKQSILRSNADYDEIYSICMKSGTGNGIPSGGSISDKTARVAEMYRIEIRENDKQIQKDIMTLSDIISKLETGIKALTPIQSVIVDLYYSEGGRTWKEVLAELKKRELCFNDRHVRRIFDYSIKTLISATQISIESYKEVIDIVEGRAS